MIENSQPNGGYVLCFGGRRIPFRVERRKRKKLAISVRPDLQLEIVAPSGYAIKPVLQRIEKRASWILKQWRYFEQFQPLPPSPQYVSGETVLYLGRQFRLRIQEAATEEVKLLGKFLYVFRKRQEADSSVRKLVESWYRKQARRIFAHRLAISLNSFPSLHLKAPPKLTIRQMRNRWGSCAKSGSISINPDLIKAPIHCLDYVILHELCHVKVRNHSASFYRLLSKHMPDWKQRKRRLERIVV